jgi:hypothetical protein
LFSQDTFESISQAIQFYIMACHAYGPRGQIVSRLTDIVPQTFKTLSNKLNAFPNAIFQFKEAFLFSKLTPLLVSKLPLDNGNHLPNVFGFAGCLYFAKSGNSSVQQLAVTIDKCLLKIRSSEDINRNFRVRLDLPRTVRRFEYDSIYDAMLQLRYTSLDGGMWLQGDVDSAGSAAVLNLNNG